MSLRVARRSNLLIEFVLAVLVMAVLPPPSAAADTSAPVGLFNSGTGEWHLRGQDGTITSFYYGIPGDIPLLGDWDCDGFDTVGVYRPSDGSAHLRNSNVFGFAEIEFFFGIPADMPIAGDWNANGCDSMGVYRDGRVLLGNNLATGPADIELEYGSQGGTPFTGDFDQAVSCFSAACDAEIGMYHETTGRVQVRGNLSTGIAGGFGGSVEFFYGIPGDQVITGDWNQDGFDSIGIWRHSDATFHLSNTNGTVFADYSFPFPASSDAGWVPVAGNLY